MPKGYWIANMTVTDPVAYDRYKAANGAPLARHGGRFLVRGGTQEIADGAAFARTVVIEFPSLEAARACYADPEYKAAKALRKDASEGNLVIVEGYDG